MNPKATYLLEVIFTMHLPTIKKFYLANCVCIPLHFIYFSEQEETLNHSEIQQSPLEENYSENQPLRSKENSDILPIEGKK